MESLIQMTALQVVNLLRKREISPLELVEASARRIAETDKSVNAIPVLCLERARKHARALQNRTAADIGPRDLLGLPVAVKDNLDVKGVPTTHGSLVYAAAKPASKSDLVVERLEQNGAIVMGKSNLPEFACGANSFNEVFGVTRNPWDLTKTAGGSSGGAAAALASGQVWLATGNDFAGSIRIPASFCSIVGFRPSPGRLPRLQKQPFSPFSIEGTMARNVADAALMYDAEVGWHPLDPLTQPTPECRYLDAALSPRAPVRIGYSSDLGVAPALDKEVRNICNAAIEKLAVAGVATESANISLKDAAKHFETLRAAIYVGRVGHLLQAYRHLIKPEVVENAEYGFGLTVAQVVAAEAGHGEVVQNTAKFFESYDILASPAFLTPAFPAEDRYLQRVEETTFDNHLSSLVLTYSITMTCCPSICVPCGFTSTGLPVGLQLVGRPRGEYDLFTAAAFAEQVFGVAEVTPIDPRPARS